jgi:urease
MMMNNSAMTLRSALFRLRCSSNSGITTSISTTRTKFISTSRMERSLPICHSSFMSYNNGTLITSSSSSSYRCANSSASQYNYYHQYHQYHHYHQYTPKYKNQHHQQYQQYQQSCRSIHISPRELSHLQLYQIGKVAQQRLANGIQLNHPEAVGLISMICMEMIRTGKYTVKQLMEIGQSILGINNVMDGIPSMIESVQIEATFPDGTKLLTIHSPITKEYGDLQLALYGSFLPIPSSDLFTTSSTSSSNTTPTLIPGEVLPHNEDITLNKDRMNTLLEIHVTNTGDRPIQVGSHYPFIETNKSLQFDRNTCIGYRLNIPSGTAIRFEAGECKTITLVKIGGTQNIICGNQLHHGIPNKDTNSPSNYKEIIKRIDENQFQNVKQDILHQGKPYSMDRQSYIDMYGPTLHDKVRLGDTELYIRIEKDYNAVNGYGEECKFGGGKTIREGMGQSTSCLSSDALDTVITNCIIVDAKTGIVKADIGIKNSVIVGIGKAGNPDIQSNITEHMIIGNTTDVIGGEHLIVTTGYVIIIMSCVLKLCIGCSILFNNFCQCYFSICYISTHWIHFF